MSLGPIWVRQVHLSACRIARSHAVILRQQNILLVPGLLVLSSAVNLFASPWVGRQNWRRINGGIRRYASLVLDNAFAKCKLCSVMHSNASYLGNASEWS